MASTYFPEPAIPDETPPRWVETAVEWLRRSTAPNARAIRTFLNKNLSCFAPLRAENLVKKLNWDWQGNLFEIVVGRYLQVLGAEVDPEPLGTNGTSVDYRATFSDGVVSIECMSKRFNLEAQEKMDREGKMSTMLDDIGPTNWAVDIMRLPAAHSAEDFQPYVSHAQSFYSTLPETAEGSQPFDFVWEGDVGPMEIQAIPFPSGTKPNHIGPVVSYYDNSIQRLTFALKDRRKRKQAIGAVRPVFLAIDAPVGGPGADEFDQALFGQTVDHRDFDPHVSVGITFNPNGLFVTDRSIPFAGVLAFTRLTMGGGAEPILYLNPYQRWKLPAAVAAHETRVWVSGIERTPPTREPTINRIEFVQLSPDE